MEEKHWLDVIIDKLKSLEKRVEDLERKADSEEPASHESEG